MNKTPTLFSIQYLRGLAAFAVVAMHTGWTRSGLGAAGVDVFFVISGFIMVYVSRREITPAAFLRARILRVVPLYWAVTLTAAAWRQDADLSRFLTSLVFWPHVGFDGRDYPVVVQGWTLNYEAFFYVLFAAVLLVPAKPGNRRLILLTVAMVGLVALGVIWKPRSLVASTYTGPLLLEFVAGAWLCRAWQRNLLLTGWKAWAVFAAGTLAFAAQVHMEPGPWRVVTWGVPSFLIVCGFLCIEAGGGLPHIPGLRALGDASYALYLTHLLVQQPLLPILHPLPTVIALPLVIAPCIAVGLVVHRYIERPLHQWLAFKPAQRLPGIEPADSKSQA